MTTIQPPRKKARLQRANTGCRDCRQRRVKCPEGMLDPHTGRKAACRKCWENDQECYYPSTAHKPSKLLKDVIWVESGPFEHMTTTKKTPEQDNILFVTSSSSGQSSSSPISPTISTLPQSLFDLPPPSASFEFNVDPNTLPTTGRPIASNSPPIDNNALDLTFFLNPPPPAHHDLFPIVNSSASITALQDDAQAEASSSDTTNDAWLALLREPYPSRSTPTSAFAPYLQPNLIKALFQPSPKAPVTYFTLASLPCGSIDRTALSYFESQGCNEIVAAPTPKANWIHSLLFPQIYHLLSTVPSSKTPQGMVRDFAYHALMQLSFVHRGNVEKDATRAVYWKSEALKHRRLGSSTVLKVKALYKGAGWKTEEYLMGFFVRCMADMLDSRDLVIDHTTACELPADTCSPNYPSLRDMIALYSTIHGSCTPLELASAQPLSGPTKPVFELPLEGPDWVERFVGYSRQFIILLGRVNGMVTYRDHLIRTGRENTLDGKMLRAQSEALSAELADPYAWLESGKSYRVEKGGIVLRLALQLMVFSELLEISLDDSRFSHVRSVAQELVADTVGHESAGYQWCLTVIAVYTSKKDDRDRTRALLDDVNSMSFGKSYNGTSEIMEMCWEIYDAQGFYTNGIAPWREAMTAFGRTVIV
ncbi:uncharacterized protein L199_001607 [Kwoniella botswanensis]|uniref:uncharacterized protein n=1 Tax=Kwoniella botswanensis TaxID=1268659 RepID=UPI00315CAB60